MLFLSSSESSYIPQFLRLLLGRSMRIQDFTLTSHLVMSSHEL